MYNLEMVKRLEHDAIGKSFLHALQSPVSELVRHFKAWPSRVCLCPRRTLCVDSCVQSLPAAVFALCPTDVPHAPLP